TVSLAGSGAAYTATVEGLTGDGTVSITIPDGSWENSDGYLGAGSEGPDVVLDTVAPEIDAPADGVWRTTTDPGQPGADVTFSFLAPTAPTGAGPAVAPDDTVACSPASGSFFPIGSTAVGCTATDPA